jgi:hypothetical protein
MTKNDLKDILAKADKLIENDINNTSSNNLIKELNNARTTIFYIWKALNNEDDNEK